MTTFRTSAMTAAVTILVTAVSFAQTPSAPAPATNAPTVTCASQAGQRQACAADTSKGVALLTQTSEAGCWEGKTWGSDAKGVWVSDGCAAQFVLGAGAQNAQDVAKEEKKSSKGKKTAIIGGIAAAAVVGSVLVAKSGGDDKPKANEGATPVPGTLSFASLDGNGDGKLSEEEFRNAMAGLFASTDTNKDKKISRAEATGRWGDKGGARFDAMDTGKAGAVEFAAFLDSGMRVFQEVDADTDGIVTVAEKDAAKAKWGEKVK